MKYNTIRDNSKSYRRVSKLTAKRLYNEGMTIYISSALSSVISSAISSNDGDFDKITSDIKTSFCDKKVGNTIVNYYIEVR